MPDDKMTAARKANWTDDQTNALIDGYVENAKLLNASFSSAVTAKQKNKTWLDILERVNSKGIQQRTVDDAKKKMSDLKVGIKKKERERRRDAERTGGGPAPFELKSSEEKVLSVISEVVLGGIPNGIDTMKKRCDITNSNEASTGEESSTAALPDESSEDSSEDDQLSKSNSSHSDGMVNSRGTAFTYNQGIPTSSNSRKKGMVNSGVRTLTYNERVPRSGSNRKKDQDHQTVYLNLETEKLEMEKEKLDMEREKMKIKRERLEIEKENIALKKRKLELVSELVGIVREKRIQAMTDEILNGNGFFE